MKKFTLLLLVFAFISCSEDEPEVPTSIIIRKVAIENMPLVESNGQAWDILSSPDIKLLITSSIGNFESAVFENFDISQNLVMNINTEVPFNQQITLTLLDFDSLDADDIMVQGTTTTNWNELGTVLLTSGSTSFTFTYDLVY